jgi:hypothetical protein
MPPIQDEIQVAPTDSPRNPVVLVNGKEVVVSSATEKPKRSLWIAWLYIFDVSLQIFRESLQDTQKREIVNNEIVVSKPLFARGEETGAKA